jgi:16S rRNA (cytosine967-C5)-methyltransferase
MKPRNHKSPATPGFSSRRAATRLVHAVLHDGQSLDDALDQPGAFAELEGRDRALARAIASTTLRRLGSLRLALARFMRKRVEPRGPIEAILLTGAAQILHMDVPDHAAVGLAVDQANGNRDARPFAPLVNAVLRNLVRERDAVLAELFDPALDVPEWMQAARVAQWGAERASAIAAAERIEPALDITVKADPADWAGRLGGVVLPTGTVRLLPEVPVVALEGYGEGAWWVQDAAAALPARLLRVKPGERVADLCAAPGGKTAQLALAGGDVLAVDRSAPRLKRLSANLDRLGLKAATRAADATALEADPFDAILLDAPCSSTGTIRRHPDVAWLKGPEDVAQLAALQARLLDRAVELLAPGGRLVYSTCSLERDEGEDQIAALLERRSDLRLDPITPDEVGGVADLIAEQGWLRTFPHHLPHAEPRLSGMDGFFAARLIRAG